VIKKIEDNFSIFIAIAFFLGLAFPGQAKTINPYIIYVLMGIMYFTILKMDLGSLSKLIMRPAYIIMLCVIVLVVTPIMFYYLSELIYPELSAAALIIGALPTALAASSLTDLLKGNVNVSLVTTIATSLLAPFTIPILIGVFIGVETEANASDMLIMLSEVIFIPFVLALITKWKARNFVSKTEQYFTVTNVALLFLTVFGPIGENSEYILENMDKTISISLYFVLLAVLLHIIGWYSSRGMDREYKIGSTVTVFYNNITLGIVFASSFFSPLITLAVVLYNVPWCLMLVPFQILLKKSRPK